MKKVKKQTNQTEKQSKIKADLLKDIKDAIADKDIIEDESLDEIRKLKEKISTNDVNLAVLYTKCFVLLEVNLLKFDTEDNKYSKDIEEYIKKLDIIELRHLVNEWGNNEKYGDYFTSENIKRLVSIHRSECLELIRFFWSLFGGDE